MIAGHRVAMTVVAALGWISVGVGCAFARRLAGLERRLREHQLDDSPPRVNRWLTDQMLRLYRPAGWPLFASAQRALAAVYGCMILGMLLIMYACPALSA